MGLGLCKKIIDNYQGQVKVDSQPGEGTTFTIEFPLGAAQDSEEKVLELVEEELRF